MKFTGSSEELTQEERFALFDLPLDMEEEQVEEETSAPDAVAAEEPAEEPEETVEGETGVEPEIDGEAALAPGEAATPEETEEPEPALDQTATEVAAVIDWKKRYDDQRTHENKIIERERARAAAAEEQLAQIVAQRAQPRITEDQLQDLAKRAEALGMEPEQIALLAEIVQTATPPDNTMVDYLSRESQDAHTSAAQALAEQEARTLASFTEDHTDLDADAMKATAEFMYNIGAAEFFDANGNELPEQIPYEVKLQAVSDGQAAFQSWPPNQPLDRYVLELAYEAVKNPDLRVVLEANPEYARTDAGLAYAREQASLRAAQRGVTTLPTPAKTTEEIDASLAAAETLGGTSGVEPVKSEPQFIERPTVHFAK
jgi:hypothetical protein